MLLRPAIAERANVYASCRAKPVAPAAGGVRGSPGERAPAAGGWGGFPDGPIRRLVPAIASWAEEGEDQRGKTEDDRAENSRVPLLCNAIDA
eukprot:8130626-Alexandrium_andersonii.AAC.1